KTGGRPQQVYILTDTGVAVFPKQYSWFARVLFQTLRSKIGDDDLAQFMFDLGVDMSAAALPRIAGKTRLECQNCVYHDLSRDYPEVCRFDIGFITGLMGADVEHEECMQRGGQTCRFRFIPPA